MSALLHPKISVVIPCDNGERYVGEAIQSILRQSRPPDEVLVVDDGSTDASAKVAGAFGSLVRVLSQDNRGESVARNRGIDESTGDWIAFCDADDLWAPTKLAEQLAVVESDTVAVSTRTLDWQRSSADRRSTGVVVWRGSGSRPRHGKPTMPVIGSRWPASRSIAEPKRRTSTWSRSCRGDGFRNSSTKFTIACGAGPGPERSPARPRLGSAHQCTFLSRTWAGTLAAMSS